MQEAQVTLHGKTHILEPPFFVVATQNPIEMEGTYPLPEAQLDRFLFKLEIALPSEKELTRILDATTGERPGPLPVSLSREQLLRLQAIVRQIPAPSTVVEAVSRTQLRATWRQPARWTVDPAGRQGARADGGTPARRRAGPARCGSRRTQASCDPELRG
jgi:MoxR-like ATPase